MLLSLRWRLPTAIALAFVIGCSGSGVRPAVPVTGKIAFSDGKLLPAGTRLMFNPGDGATESAVAVVAADGTFEAERVSGRKGLLIGRYTVLLRAPEANDGSFFKLVPSDYVDGGMLDADVQPDMPPLSLVVKVRKR